MIYRRFFLSISVLLLLSGTIFGQQTPRFRALVDQVVVYASVYDADGALVTGLTADDFQVFEDRIEQEILTFERTEVPSTIGLVLDTSGSMRRKMALVEEALYLFLDQTNPDHELFLIRFDDEVELEEDFTREFDDIRDAIGNVIVKGGTALYDAIYLAVDKARDGSEPKKVAVVFTDGEDKDSYYTREELVEKVREGETGGKAFFPQKIEELGTVFEGIARELKNQYRLSYRSSNTENTGGWRRIDVKIVGAKEKGFRVRARKGYYPDKAS